MICPTEQPDFRPWRIHGKRNQFCGIQNPQPKDDTTMRWKQYWIAIAAVIVLRTLDLGITAIYTPDLEQEWNPLVSFFGGSWGTLIVTQVLILAFTITMMFFYFRREPTVIEPRGLNLNDFLRAYFTGTHEHSSKNRGRADLRSFLLIPDKNDETGSARMKLRMNHHLIFNGWLFMNAVILISIFAVIHNFLLISENLVYMKFVASSYQIYFPAVFASGVVISAISFAVVEYRSYWMTP